MDHHLSHFEWDPDHHFFFHWHCHQVSTIYHTVVSFFSEIDHTSAVYQSRTIQKEGSVSSIWVVNLCHVYLQNSGRNRIQQNRKMEKFFWRSLQKSGWIIYGRKLKNCWCRSLLSSCESLAQSFTSQERNWSEYAELGVSRALSISGDTFKDYSCSAAQWNEWCSRDSYPYHGCGCRPVSMIFHEEHELQPCNSHHLAELYHQHSDPPLVPPAPEPSVVSFCEHVSSIYSQDDSVVVFREVTNLSLIFARFLNGWTTKTVHWSYSGAKNLGPIFSIFRYIFGYKILSKGKWKTTNLLFCTMSPIQLLKLED